jgi:hypothetical protein
LGRVYFQVPPLHSVLAQSSHVMRNLHRRVAPAALPAVVASFGVASR